MLTIGARLPHSSFLFIGFFSTYCNPSDIAFEMNDWVFGSEMVVFDVHDIADLAMDLLG